MLAPMEKPKANGGSEVKVMQRGERKLEEDDRAARLAEKIASKGKGSAEEREKEYQNARARIFNQDCSSPTSSSPRLQFDGQGCGNGAHYNAPHLQYPIRPGEPDCAFYLKCGSCKFGETCKFNHPPDKLSTSGVSSGGTATATLHSQDALMCMSAPDEPPNAPLWQVCGCVRARARAGGRVRVWV